MKKPSRSYIIAKRTTLGTVRTTTIFICHRRNTYVLTRTVVPLPSSTAFPHSQTDILTRQEATRALRRLRNSNRNAIQ